MLFAATTISRAPVVLIAAVAIGAVAPGFLMSEPTAETELEPATAAPEWDSFRAENLAVSDRSLEGLSDESKVRVRQEPGASAPMESPLRVWGDTRPERITDVAPTYPEAARDERIQGLVVLEIGISATGEVTEVTVLRSADPLIDQAAVEAARRWTYAPTVVNDVAVPVIMTETVNFDLTMSMGLDPRTLVWLERRQVLERVGPLTRSGDSWQYSTPGGLVTLTFEDGRVSRVRTATYEFPSYEGIVYPPDHDGVEPPSLLQGVLPNYTAEATERGIQGTVLLWAVVLPNGSVGEAIVRVSLDAQFGLDQEAVKAVRQWRLAPGLLEGEPVAVLTLLEVSFGLADQTDQR